MNNQSYAVIPAEKAKELAENLIKRIKAMRLRNEEAYLASSIKRINSGWFRRHFKKPITLEEVIKMEETAPLPTPLYWIRQSGCGLVELASNVLTAAQYSDSIHLTLEDMSDLSHYGRSE